MDRREMVTRIRELGFASGDLGLYLDTHPEEQKAIHLHKEYSMELSKLKEEYQTMYGPLTMHYPSDQWRWIDEPWPWEGGNY